MKREIFNQYVTKVANQFQISEAEIFANDKRQVVSQARHLLYYLCFYRPMTLKQIDDYMRERGYNNIRYNHVMHGIKAATKRVNEDADYQIVVDRIEKATKI